MLNININCYMKKNNLNIDKLITIDDTGMPCKPDIRQLQDKDILNLYQRDLSKDKHRYIQECGIIYYLADPSSPAKQQGLSDKEALNMAIDNFDLPKDYLPDPLVKRLIDKYYISNITEAGVALETLRKSLHLITIAANKINEILNKKLSTSINDDEVASVLSIMDSVTKRISEIPMLTKSLATAYENLRKEEEEQIARGGIKILSSMDADEEII